ncbi:EthD domain-containing protein [Hypoxylon fragiforme]|uniref:EthD domain-containing protein n=1 Tax=Hypoxylon fragiforme TaxID=63214 RepID=UPI0020C72C1D|nr:EthD domain-containing protein [Hypoxylon fragiforme]KAI2603264.1 EthD domain-containing protein [Hypoxylon fragiforme]
MPWSKVSHEFTHPQLSYEAKPNFQPYIKISVFFKKLDSVDFDTFFGHWQTVHADLAVATHGFRKHVVRYVQHHQTPEMKERIRSLGGNVLDYDACAQVYVREWDDWLTFYKSEEYAAALGEDSPLFMQLPVTYMVGHENLVVGDASGQMGGDDGLNVAALV